ncbi:MAG: hypothetical protein M1491_01765 [Deltaproteobacteria bacterium]|nr:hypothetical protein [Deltaproteobacteria bacterium]
MKKLLAITIMTALTASCSGGNTSLPPASSFTLTSAGNGIYVLSQQWGIVTRIDMTTLGLTTYDVGTGADMILPVSGGVAV